MMASFNDSELGIAMNMVLVTPDT